MTLKVALYSSVWEFGPVSGTGPIGLPSVAETGYRTFNAVVPTGAQINYRVKGRTSYSFEQGVGLFYSGASFTGAISPFAAAAAPTVSAVSYNTSTAYTAYTKITWLTAAGESLPSAQVVTSIPANEIAVTQPGTPPAGAIGYNVYMGTASGAESFQGTSSNVTGSAYFVSPPSTGGTAPPTVSTAGSILTVSTVASGAVEINTVLSGASVAASSSLLADISGTGAAGTYLVTGSQTVASEAMQTLPTITRNPVESTSANGIVNFDGEVCDIVIDILSPKSGNDGTQAGGVVPLTRYDGYLDESFMRWPAWNYKPTEQLKALLYAIACTQAGTPARFKIGFGGDSTCAGVYGLPNGSTPENCLLAVCYRFMQALRASGINATSDNVCAGHYGSDARLTISGNWTSSGATTMGGGALFASAAGTITFTPDYPFDTVDVYVIDQATTNEFSVAVNGGAVIATVSETNTGGVKCFTVPVGSLKSGNVNIAWVAGSIYVAAIACYSVAEPQIECYNFGVPGAVSSDLVTNSGYSQMQGILAVAPNAFYYEVGINDCNTYNVTPAQFLANITAVVASFAALGTDFIYGVPHPINSPADGVLDTYFSALQPFALSANFPIVNFHKYYGPEALFLAANLLPSTLHPDPAVYTDKANILAGLFLPAARPHLKANSQTVVAAPTAPASTSAFTMQGLGATISPSATGNVLVMISGTITATSGTIADGISYQLSYGTGTAPAAAAALTGTQVGPVGKYTTPVAETPADVHVPFSVNYLVPKMLVGAAYWFDLAAEALTAASSTALSNVSITLTEV